MRYFQRQVIFQMIPAGSLEGLSFQGLATTFVAEKGVSGRGKGLVSVYGLSADDRALAEALGTTFRVLAGYDVPSVILEGQAIKSGVDSQRQGPEQILQVEIRDAGRRSELAHVNLSWSDSVTVAEVLDAVASELGIPLGAIKLPSTASEVLPYGITLTGTAWSILERLTESIGAEVATIDGSLQILGHDETSGIEAPVISPIDGTLVGTPNRKDGGRVEFVTFLDGRYRPGGVVAVRDIAKFDGDYRIESLKHEGSSGYDATYYTTLNCRRLRPR